MRRHISIAALVLLTMATAVATASARPADKPYRDRVQTGNNSAGVIFHPYGDYWEVWNNGPGDYGVSINYHYKGIKDRWKSAGEIKAPGHSWTQHNVAEGHQIYFRIIGPDNTISQTVRYRTSGH